MRKVALVFILAVLAPSLVLAWLAVRSLNDQRLVLERQRALLYQGVADALVKTVQDRLAETQREFAQHVESILGKDQPLDVAATFDDRLRSNWPLAEVGFVVSLQGRLYGPSLFGRPEARRFRLENDRFLCNRESVEVYWNSPKGPINLTSLDAKGGEAARAARSEPRAPLNPFEAKGGEMARGSSKEDAVKVFATKSKGGGKDAPEEEAKGPPGEAEFRQVVGDSYEGTLARFLQDKLKLLFWYRSQRDPELVFGAQVNLDQLVRPLKQLVNIESPLTNDICVTLIDDTGKLVATTHPAFSAGAVRPFVAAEIGERLPHWQMAVHLLHPERLGRAATTARLTLGLLVALLLFAIAIGSGLIVADLRRQLTLARQKTDFVSNVSHELKTPLTSIRMFSEMLAEGRVSEPDKQRQFL
ncbi:MAG TPA: histidine kinase dimerization/phospho-acceptor domain-containing protein, partial [Verrucomicrobiae bacterium]